MQFSAANRDSSGQFVPDDRDSWQPEPAWDAHARAGTSAVLGVSPASHRRLISGGASFVAMVQPADFREGDHVTLSNGLHTSRRRRVFRQREMGPGSVIVRNIPGEGASQMCLIEHDHVIQALATNGPDQLTQFSVNPRGAPQGIRRAHLRDESPNAGGRARAGPDEDESSAGPIVVVAIADASARRCLARRR